MRLNQFIAHSGVTSRRGAEALILGGEIKVNGVVQRLLSYRVRSCDRVLYRGRLLAHGERVYLILHKKGGYITTVRDDRGRRTVMRLLGGATSERVYPVGRLDRATTGLLFFTNDGELANALSHPSFGIEKRYQVFLGRALSSEEEAKILGGILLEDGWISADRLVRKGEGCVVLTLHSGRNRIVRRIFAHLGHTIRKLTRIGYGGLSLKGLGLGRYRHLRKEEVDDLRRLTSGSTSP